MVISRRIADLYPLLSDPTGPAHRRRNTTTAIEPTGLQRWRPSVAGNSAAGQFSPALRTWPRTSLQAGQTG